MGIPRDKVLAGDMLELKSMSHSEALCKIFGGHRGPSRLVRVWVQACSALH